MVLLYAERYTDALSYFTEAVKTRQVALGPDHPEVGCSLTKIGMINLVHGNARKAQDVFLAVLKIFRKSLGYGHIKVAQTLNNLAVTQFELQAYSDAMNTLLQAQEILRRLAISTFTNDSAAQSRKKIIDFSLIHTLNNIGLIYCKQGKHEEGLLRFQEALNIVRAHQSVDEASTVEFIYLAKDIERNTNYTANVVYEYGGDEVKDFLRYLVQGKWFFE